MSKEKVREHRRVLKPGVRVQGVMYRFTGMDHYVGQKMTIHFPFGWSLGKEMVGQIGTTYFTLSAFPSRTNPRKPQCFYLSAEQHSQKRDEIVAALGGLVVGQALAILRDCKSMICDTASVLSVTAVESGELSQAVSDESPGQHQK